MPSETEGDDRTERIAALNDAFRQAFQGGRVVVTRGVAAKGEAFVQEVSVAVQAFERFDRDNDPHGEHDFGAIDVGQERLFWKIDYYDLDLAMASPDPADPDQTIRVLTIMCADEY